MPLVPIPQQRRAALSRYEVILPFRHREDDPPPLRAVRSTLLSASLTGLRSMGWEERYFAALPKELHPVMRCLVAGVWTPASTALAHYRACDGMNLSTREMMAMGEAVSLRTQGTFVGTLGKAASGAGATPWHLFSQVHRIWGRMVDGGDNCVYRAGPKECVVTLVGVELLRIPYFRIACRAYYKVLAALVTKVVYMRDIPELATERDLVMRFSWV
jgi:hypothetical protein